MYERFIEKVFITDTCWLWAASLDGRGYGQFVYNRIHYRAHRIAYSIFRGDIPEGLDIDHLCRDRRCVNPAHLEAVTRSVNLLRGELWQSKKTHCPKGHEYDYVDRRGGRRCKRCLRENAHRNYLKRKGKYVEGTMLSR